LELASFKIAPARAWITLEDKMWEIDPVDLWMAAALSVGYSLPFVALFIEFKLQDLKRRAEEKEIQKAILRRLTGHD
jgi:hypothetical protein